MPAQPIDYYSTSSEVVPRSDYYNTVGTNTEPDIRQEFIDMFEGKWPQVPKAQRALLRKFRRDGSGNLLLCSCVDLDTREPDKDTYCPISMGERYLWDESYIDIYKVIGGGDQGLSTAKQSFPLGLINIPLTVFYMRYDVDVTEDDKIVEIALDVEGQLVSPLRRTSIYRINTLIGFRSDRGRLEYYKAACSRESVRFLNAPAID